MVDRLISLQTHGVPINQLNQIFMQIHEYNEFFIQLFVFSVKGQCIEVRWQLFGTQSRIIAFITVVPTE